ncbi:MAG: hypothetical protein IJ623_05340 [Bacteroidales bacterium]|nr:hypothetical protein [Bacteroidales bacterium]
MTIAVDFDGTIVEHKYPKIGREKPFAIDTLRRMQSKGHKLILWTSREGELLEDAILFCKDRGLTFYAINSDTPAGSLNFSDKTTSKKLVADIYIDDRNLGGLPDWGEIYEIVNGTRRISHHKHHHKRSFLQRLFGR